MTTITTEDLDTGNLDLWIDIMDILNAEAY
jgi:hypothetical protein